MDEAVKPTPTRLGAHSNGGKMLKVTQNEIDQVEFDLDALSGQEMSDLNAAERTGNLAAGAEILARAVTACPWGDPHDPQTYLKPPARVYFKVSQRLGQALGEDLKK